MIAAQSPPPSGATAKEGAKALRALIARCQRRAWLRLFVRYGAAGCSIALFITSGLWYVNPATAASVLWPLAAAGVVAAASVMAAWWQCPSTGTVAAALDNRLALDDSVVAALQVHDGNSLLAPLIVGQAVARAGAASPGDVFPIHLRIPTAAIGAGLLVLALAALTAETVTTGSTTNPRSRLAGDSSAAHASPPLGEKNGLEDAPRAERNDADATEAQVADEPGRPASLADAARAPARGAAIDTGEAAAANAPLSRDARAAGPAGGSREPTSETGAPGGGTGTERVAAGAEDAASGSAADSAHGRDQDIGRGSGGFAVGQSSGSGGVRGGGLLAASRSDAVAAGPTRRGIPPSRQQPRDREAAAASDAVPPELREHVRRYFSAVTSASERP